MVATQILLIAAAVASSIYGLAMAIAFRTFV
jgi:hypothetical protein